MCKRGEDMNTQKYVTTSGLKFGSSDLKNSRNGFSFSLIAGWVL